MILMRTVEHHIDADRRAFDIDADCRASSIRKRECFGNFIFHRSANTASANGMTCFLPKKYNQASFCIFAGRVVTTDNTGALFSFCFLTNLLASPCMGCVYTAHIPSSGWLPA